MPQVPAFSTRNSVQQCLVVLCSCLTGSHVFLINGLPSTLRHTVLKSEWILAVIHPISFVIHHPSIHHIYRRTGCGSSPQRDTPVNPNCCISWRWTKPQCREGAAALLGGWGLPDVLRVLEDGECFQARREGHCEQKEEHIQRRRAASHFLSQAAGVRTKDSMCTADARGLKATLTSDGEAVWCRNAM